MRSWWLIGSQACVSLLAILLLSGFSFSVSDQALADAGPKDQHARQKVLGGAGKREGLLMSPAWSPWAMAMVWKSAEARPTTRSGGPRLKQAMSSRAISRTAFRSERSEMGGSTRNRVQGNTIASNGSAGVR